MHQKASTNFPLQFAILIGMMGVALIITSLMIAGAGSLILHVPYNQVGSSLSKPENINFARFLNTLGSVIVFLFPAWFMAKRVSDQPFQFLGFNKAISFKQVISLLVILFTGIMLSGALGELNEKIPLPAKLLAKAKQLEEEYKVATMSMANMKNWVDYLLALIVMAIAPAIFEEVLFRGGFQQVLVGWTKSKWTGIILTSILFSAFHFSFFGFLPRVALGMILGLVFSYSQNLWLNILLHFLNNALVVTQLYMASMQGKSIEKTMDESIPMWWGLVGLALLFLFFRSFKQESVKVIASYKHDIFASPENNIS